MGEIIGYETHTQVMVFVTLEGEGEGGAYNNEEVISY